MATATTKLWVSVGQAGDYEPFDTLADAAKYMNSLSVGKPTGWKFGGFDTPNFWGNDYVSIYHGDDVGEYVEHLSDDEQCEIYNRLEEVYL